jgi:hypothetical protein
MTHDSDVLIGFRSALATGIARHLARSRRRQRNVRRAALAGAVCLVALALILTQPFERGESAIARARAALVLPTTGILHVVTRNADGVVVEEVWQSLSNPNEHRTLNADSKNAYGPFESAIADGIWMRFDAEANTIYTQRVIEAVGAFTETVNLPDVHRWLGLPGSRDRGVVERDGRSLREIELPGAQGTPESSCTYYADAQTFLPARLECSPDGGPPSVTDYAFLPDTAANRAHFSLASVHPGAAVAQDPNGIPGKAGNDLSAVTASGLEDATAGRDYLEQTDEVSMRNVREQQVALNRALEECFATHGAYRVPLVDGTEGYTFHDPTRTVGAICQHFSDGAYALYATPAGTALSARMAAHAQAVARCIESRKPSADQRDSVGRECVRMNPDPFLAGLPRIGQ